MAEISKAYKIVLLIMAGIGIAYGVQWIFLTDIIYAITASPFQDPFMARGAGVTLLCLGVFNILAVMKAEVEKIRLYVEFVIVWLIPTTILIIMTMFDPVLAAIPMYMLSMWIALTIYAGSTALVVIFYFREIK